MLQLANSDKYISVSEWQGVTHIHIHTYFNSNGGAGSGSGELLPTKKVVTLITEEWKDLKAYINHVDAMIAFSEDDVSWERAQYMNNHQHHGHHQVLSQKHASTNHPVFHLLEANFHRSERPHHTRNLMNQNHLTSKRRKESK